MKILQKFKEKKQKHEFILTGQASSIIQDQDIHLLSIDYKKCET